MSYGSMPLIGSDPASYNVSTEGQPSQAVFWDAGVSIDGDEVAVAETPSHRQGQHAPSGTSSSPPKVRWEDQTNAMEQVFAIRAALEPLTEAYVRDVEAMMANPPSNWTNVEIEHCCARKKIMEENMALLSRLKPLPEE